MLFVYLGWLPLIDGNVGWMWKSSVFCVVEMRE